MSFRDKSAELYQAAQVQLESPSFAADPRVQLTATVGFCKAAMYEVADELAEFIQGANRLNKLEATRMRLAEQNRKLREAAAKGDWNEFDRIATDGPREVSGAPGESGGDIETPAPVGS